MKQLGKKEIKVAGHSNKYKENSKVMTIAMMKRIAKHNQNPISCDQWYFETADWSGTPLTDLLLAHPIWQPCWHAIVGSTDTIWIWSVWAWARVDTGTSSQTYLWLSDTSDNTYTWKDMFIPFVDPALTPRELTLMDPQVVFANWIEKDPEVFIVANDWDITFVLSQISLEPTKTKMYINWQYATQWIHYTMVWSTITWLWVYELKAWWIVTVHYI